jgi:hypothetical protein
MFLPYNWILDSGISRLLKSEIAGPFYSITVHKACLLFGYYYHFYAEAILLSGGHNIKLLPFVTNGAKTLLPHMNFM